MSVAVVVPDGHQADTRVDAVVQGVALIGRTVVGDLHDVHGAESAGAVELRLLVLAEITEEEAVDTGAGRTEDETAGVPAQGGLPRPGRRRPDELPAEPAERSGRARMDLLDRDAGQ